MTKRGTRSFWEYLLGGVGVLLVLLVGAFSLARGVAQRQRDRALSAIKKPEIVGRYEELSAPKQVRPDVAKTPETRSEGIDTWASTDKLARWEQLLARWDRFDADKSKDGWRGTMLSFGLDLTHYRVAEEGKSPRELSPEEWARIYALMAREQELVREILDVAQLGGPICKLDFTPRQYWEMPHHEPLRGMCGFLAWDANVKAHAGDVAGAVESLDGGMKLGNALLEEPLISSQIIRKCIAHQVAWGLREGFVAGQIAPDQLRRILGDPGKASVRKAFADAVQAQSFVRVRDLASQRSKGTPSSGIFNMDGGSPGATESAVGRFVLRAYTGPLGKPWFDADLAAFADAMQCLANAAKEPYYQAKTQVASVFGEPRPMTFTHPFSGYMLSGDMSGLRLLAIQAASEAQIDLTWMGLLIERHRALHGECPQTMDAIVADLGGALPVDPFSGQGYRYVVSGNDFLLYSVGQNQRDDGGTPGWPDGDIIWRGERSIED